MSKEKIEIPRIAFKYFVIIIGLALLGVFCFIIGIIGAIDFFIQ